jgi:hypothetical protein
MIPGHRLSLLIFPHDFPEFLQENVELVPQLWYEASFHTSFPNHYSLIILPVNVTLSELLTVSLSKPQINNLKS